MTWREKCVIRILLIVALIVNQDSAIATEIRNLTAHVNVNAPKPERDEE